MEDFNKIIDSVRFSDLAEKSIKEFSNWLFGISIGICSLLIVGLNNSDIQYSCQDKWINLIVIFISFINCFLIGFCKYKIHQRDIRISVIQGALNKKATLAKIENKTASDFKPDFQEDFNKWVEECNKIVKIGNLLNWCIYIGCFTLIITASFIIYLKL